MATFLLEAEVREERGKEKIKKLRANGTAPAIVYGAEGESISLNINTRQTEMLLNKMHGEKVLVDLHYGDHKDKAFVRKIQRDPVNEKLLHIDFYRVDPNHEIDTVVPVYSVGNPIGVKMGGLLEPGLRSVRLRALPANVPPHIDVNIENINIGESFHVGDLSIENVKILTEEEAVLFAVHGKQKEEEEDAEAAEEPATS